MNLDYSVKGVNKRRSGGGVKMGVGIHEKVRFLEPEETDKHIDILWEAPDGKTQKKRLFHPSDTYKPTLRDGETEEDAKQREVDENIEHLRDYCYLCYAPAEVDEVSGKTYRDLAHKLLTMLKAKINDFYVNLKVIPTSDLQYTEIPRYAGGYIELWREGMKPTLKFSEWEVKNRLDPLNEPAPATEETVVKPNLFNVA